MRMVRIQLKRKEHNLVKSIRKQLHVREGCPSYELGSISSDNSSSVNWLGGEKDLGEMEYSLEYSLSCRYCF